MEKDLRRILEQGRELILSAKDESELKNVKSKIFGKFGTISEALKQIPTLPPEMRPELGRATNRVKNQLSEIFEFQKEKILSDTSSVISENFDYSAPGTPPENGGLHPITQMCYDLNDAFRSLGFEIFAERDITSELYAFDNLNFPPEHPARESMDTYWLKNTETAHGGGRLCLRPHLTGASIRYLQTHKAPFRFVYPGTVYRNESTDARHERTFFQYEALIVDHEFSFSSGKVMIKAILSKVFGYDVPIRMRVGYFPFVEPGFEIDMQCAVCHGSGCSTCKHVGWIEIMPGGTPHPNVLKSAGLDPKEYTGFYINIGLDRLVMMRYGVNDIRLLHNADLRFLYQFN